MNIDYGPLPPALASLRPQEVHAYLRDQPPIVRIKPFGMHTTGTRGIPCDVISGAKIQPAGIGEATQRRSAEPR
jgi:hypothetical protein